LINCLQTAADKAAPRVKINFQKRWWSEELDQLKQQCIEVTNFVDMLAAHALEILTPTE